MNLSELSLRRPVLAMVCSILIIIFGLIGQRYLSVREYPAIDPAVINVQTSYVGANADIIEQQITEPLEKVINGIQGVVNIRLTSERSKTGLLRTSSIKRGIFSFSFSKLRCCKTYWTGKDILPAKPTLMVCS